MAERPTLAPEKVSDAVKSQIAGFHRAVVDEVAAAVGRDRVVVVGMAQNPFVKKARSLLDQEGVKHTYLEYGSYLSKWKERLAIKLWSGFPTFPMVFVDGVLEGGYADLVKLRDQGRLKPQP
ncbi:glutaredoxin [Sorangium sp. So ce854]|uniref:glutaredoxin n=1 Tax=Sorangium sp. So ce854 TaxID=3133322 RepID=UPI003F5DF901